MGVSKVNKLKDLIHELCPNGVEYKKLGDVASISRGGSFQKKDFCEEGIPCIHYGQIYTKYGLFTDKTITFINAETAKKQKFATKNDIVMAVTSENIAEETETNTETPEIGEDNGTFMDEESIFEEPVGNEETPSDEISEIPQQEETPSIVPVPNNID